MKLALYVLLFSILVGCKNSPNDKKNEVTTSNEATLISEEKFVKSLCTLAIDRNSGEFIKSDEAWGKLEMYKTFREKNATVALPYSRDTDIYGFVFGIDKVRELIKKIDDINASVGKDSLVGVRVYYARTRNHGNEIPDVFLIPVSAKKKNVYNVDDNLEVSPFTEVALVLNTSVPCPNKCTQ